MKTLNLKKLPVSLNVLVKIDNSGVSKFIKQIPMSVIKAGVKLNNASG